VTTLISRTFGSQEVTSWATVFLQSDAVAITLFATCFVRLLYEGGIYFFGNPTDINNSLVQ